MNQNNGTNETTPRIGFIGKQKRYENSKKDTIQSKKKKDKKDGKSWNRFGYIRNEPKQTAKSKEYLFFQYRNKK